MYVYRQKLDTGPQDQSWEYIFKIGMHGFIKAE